MGSAAPCYAAAWSSGDASAAAESFTADAVRVDAAGGVQRGREAIAAALDALVHRTLSLPGIAFRDGEVRSLPGGYALWRGTMGITPAGGPPLTGHVVFLMRREADRWRIVEAHPKLYPPPPPPAGATEAVLARAAELVTALNAGDARAAAAVYAEDGVRVGAWGDAARGREAIRTAYEKMLHGPMRGARMEVELTARAITADVVVVEGPLTIRPPSGPPVDGYAVDVWKRVGDRWDLAQGNPKLYPQRP